MAGGDHQLTDLVVGLRFVSGQVGPEEVLSPDEWVISELQVRHGRDGARWGTGSTTEARLAVDNFGVERVVDQ